MASCGVITLTKHVHTFAYGIVPFALEESRAGCRNKLTSVRPPYSVTANEIKTNGEHSTSNCITFFIPKACIYMYELSV